MNLPLPGDYIDIHTHDSQSVAGIFAVENLMAHEERLPADLPGRCCTYGIHPWHLDFKNADDFIGRVHSVAASENLIAIGEAGFDKLRGPAPDLQVRVFEAQVRISEKLSKPLYIHCVRAWDELLPVHKRLRPAMPWIIHGFRGNVALARQLLAKGMYLSFWFDFVVRPEASDLIRSLPSDRIFLETDGAGVDIRDIYRKVAGDLNMDEVQLREVILENFRNFFKSDL
jgi:TatD DNase family protein